MQQLEATALPLSVAIAIVAYSLCSSTLLLANKMAIHYLPSASVISFVQLLFGTVAVIALKVLNISNVDWFEMGKMRSYSLYVVIFVTAIYCNMKALAISNVETIIVFRACSPIAVSIIEYYFMDRELPSWRSSLALSVVALGAIIYCMSDSQFSLNGIAAYSWVTIYFFLITLEMTIGKKLTSTVRMDSIWGPVLYCNALSLPMMLTMGLFDGNFMEKLMEVPFVAPTGLMIIMFSCVVGVLIGCSGWLARGMVSATTYTLVGVVNKFLTVLLNVFVWDKHSTPLGLIAVCVCLLAGAFYQQAPRREVKAVGAAAAVPDIEEGRKRNIVVS